MLFCLWLLGVPQAGAESAATFEHLQGLGRVSYHEVPREGQRPYHIYVSEPREAALDRQRLPVVYLLDGGLTFPQLAAHQAYLRFAGRTPALILVGISYGTDDWRQGNRRSHDFTLTVASRPHWGGAESFHHWLVNTLFPLIEQRYPADPTRRVLFGQSLGGQFAIYVAQHHGDDFVGLIASNAALNAEQDSALANALLTATASARRPRLVLTEAEGDDARFVVGRAHWLDHWRAQAAANRPFDLYRVSLMQADHFSAGPGAFAAGLEHIFKAGESSTTAAQP